MSFNPLRLIRNVYSTSTLNINIAGFKLINNQFDFNNQIINLNFELKILFEWTCCLYNSSDVFLKHFLFFCAKIN